MAPAACSWSCLTSLSESKSSKMIERTLKHHGSEGRMACELYFSPFPVRPPCPRFHHAPSQRSYASVSSLQWSSPQAISHGFLSVHHHASVSLPLNGARSELFPTVSVRPPCRRFRPSQRSSPQAISHGFPYVSASLPPIGALLKLFSTVSRPSSVSSLKCRSPAAKFKLNEPKHRRCFWEKNIAT